jgi:small subunit ribosomal protein S6
MNRNYELMFIVRPDMVDEDLNKLISTLESSVTSAGGTAKSEVWGKRRLAYRVGKFNDGIFVLMMIEATGAIVHEVERRLRVTEPVIKFLTVRTDEELKRLDKIKKMRDSKKKASAQPAAAAPAPVTPAPPGSGRGSTGLGASLGWGIRVSL